VKVFVVLKGSDREGYDDPLGVFSSLEVASKFAKTRENNEAVNREWVDIFALDLDSAEMEAKLVE